jgi:pimeloyl-ACP methyl ester carboxylesterase
MTTTATRDRNSTIDRTSARAAACLADAVERWAPAAGAALAARLWFTVPSVPASRRAGHERPGRPFTVAVNGREVHGRSIGAGPVVYLVHGWGGWSGQLEAFVAPLVDAGYRVVSYDAPSHGRSAPGRLGPRRSSAVEMADALAAVVKDQGPAAGIVAHSLGCLATAHAMRGGLTAERVVFIAPIANPDHYLGVFVRALGFGPRVLARTRALLARRVGLAMDQFDVPRVAREAPTPPLVVIHDEDDREVGWHDGDAIARSWPAATLVTTRGLGHRRILRDPLVVAEVAAFFDVKSWHHGISSQ